MYPALFRSQHEFFFPEVPKGKKKGKERETGCSQCKVTKHELEDDDENKVLELSRTNVLLLFVLARGFEALKLLTLKYRTLKNVRNILRILLRATLQGDRDNNQISTQDCNS